MKGLFSCLIALLFTAGAFSAVGSMLLSPGSLGLAEIAISSQCATFSWSSEPADRDFELVIYSLKRVDGETVETAA
jgi:hypothetical protein